MRGRGAASALVVTDRPVPRPLVAVLPPRPAAPHVGITAVTLDGPRGGESLVVTLSSSDDRAREVRVSGDRGPSATTTVPARGHAVVRLDAAATPVARDGPGSICILTLEPTDRAGPAQGLGTRVTVRRPHVVSAIHVDRVAPGSPLDDVLTVAGFAAPGRRAASPQEAQVALRVGGPLAPRPADGEAGMVVLAPVLAPDAGAAPGTSLVVVTGPAAAVRGTDVSGAPGAADVTLPAPGSRLVADVRIDGGTAWLRDPAGSLVASDGRSVAIAFDPGRRGDAFARDPAFAALILAAIEHAAGGPDELVVTGARPADGWASAAPPPATSPPGAQDVAAAVRTDESRGRAPAVFLALAAAVLALIAARLSR
jgi:hypothetical protein